ncbi:MAG: dipeptide/oligopeptide/nickel ABC transporter permease/ATP-binding protein [Gordonia sp. (in: high G+C Gram-positive bacteria)]
MTSLRQEDPSPHSWSSARRRNRLRALVTDPFGMCSIVILAVIIGSCLLAPLLASHDPNATELSAVLQGPSGSHLLGTDSAGRDVWSRLLHGGRTTFTAAALAVFTSVIIGVPAGLFAGYRGGRTDLGLSAIAAVIIASPTMVILLAARAAFGPSIVATMVVLGVHIAPSFFRLVRSVTAGVRDAAYVDAARVSGIGGGEIVRRHVLLAVRAPLIVQLVEVAGVAVAVQAGLEFLGLGNPLVPNWGSMLSEGFRNVYIAPELLVWPAVAIVVTVVCLAIVGNALRDVLELTSERPRGARPAAPRTEGPEPEPVNVAGAAERVDDADDDALLAVRGYHVVYPGPAGVRAVVHDVDLRVGPGEIVGLVGESGSGKTQIALSALGLLPATARVRGSYRVAGRELVAADGTLDQTTSRALRGRTVGFVPQEPMANLDPNSTIGAQLARPLRTVGGLSVRAARSRVYELLAEVGIADAERVARSHPWQISGGMAQRVLIAGAIGSGPDLLVADEPTTALDVSVQAGILDLLHGIRANSGTSILIVTHDFGVVADICDRVVVLSDGGVVEDASARDVLTRPRHPYTKALLNAHVAGHPPLTMIDPQSVTSFACTVCRGGS